MYHNLFNHKPTEERLGWFQVWVLIKKTALNICVHFFGDSFQCFLVNTKEHNCWHINCKSMFSSVRNHQLSSEVAVPLASHQQRMRILVFVSTSLPALGIIGILEFDHSHNCVVVFYYHLIFIILMIPDVWLLWWGVS